jgi:hypothetical protein
MDIAVPPEPRAEDGEAPFFRQPVKKARKTKRASKPAEPEV